MALLALVDQRADGDFLRGVEQFALRRLMETEAFNAGVVLAIDPEVTAATRSDRDG